MKLATAEQMRGLDAAAINQYGIPGIVLMENAGRAVVDVMKDYYGPLAGKTVSIFAGPGNNGGDGLAIARHLHRIGAMPVVYLLARPEKMKGEGALNLAIVRKLPIPLIPVNEIKALSALAEKIAGTDLAVDAIFGTGLTREVRGVHLAAIDIMNDFARSVIAVDVPSGLNSDTGHPLGACVHADATVTFGLAKPGLVSYPGLSSVGILHVADIGIPAEAVSVAGIDLELLREETICGMLPRRAPTDHKGTFGHLLVLAGSTGKTGAALLCAKGALRAGAGLVTLAVPGDLNHIFETALWEAMTIALPHSTKGRLAIDDYETIVDASTDKSAIVLGPGIGMMPETESLVLRLYAKSSLPMVVDADALNILARHGTSLSSFSGPRILTPHPGEMARLIGTNTKDVQKDRIGTAREFAKHTGTFVVLKGAATVIASPDGRAALNPTGNPAMAAGGMGDVLCGVIGCLLCQKLAPWEAACAGVYVHGLSGDMTAGNTTGIGMLASETADGVSAALNAILQRERGKTCSAPKTS